MMLDFDPAVVAFSSQPFWLLWHDRSTGPSRRRRLTMPRGRPSPLLSQLPRRVAPFPGEILSSYLRRLAHANCLDPEALRGHIAGRYRQQSVPADRLAIAAGVPAATLEHALADLDGGKVWIFRLGQIPIHPMTSGPACGLCAFARGATEPVWCRKHPEQVICLRHRRWIGTGAATAQPCLDGQPDILQAHKQHLRLVRRFGREQVMIGFAFADHICRQWHAQRQHDEGFRRRMRIFHGPDWEVPAADPTIAAAAYPQVVALARLLISPYWGSLAVSFYHIEHSLFAQEMQNTVAPGYQWPQPRFSKDPLHRWIIGGNRKSAFDFLPP